MKYSYVLVLILISSVTIAQSVRGRVISEHTKQPIPFAHLAIDGSMTGTSADLDGKFALPAAPPLVLNVSCVGYKKIQVSVVDAEVIIMLQEDPTELREVLIVAGENPAHKILRKVRKNIPLHDPHQRNTYTFTSYNKLFITLDDDADVFKRNVDLKAKMDTSELFLTESIVAHKFRKPDQLNKLLLAHKTSGVKNPLVAGVLTEFQPMSFYDQWFFASITDKHYLNPLFDDHFTKYAFELTDTLYTYPDSTFIITFYPKANKNFEGLKGVLQIHSDGYALHHVTVESCSNTDGFGFSFQQKYSKVNDQWFPSQLASDVFIRDKQNILYGIHYINKSYFSNVQLDVPLSKKSFKPLTFLTNKSSVLTDSAFNNLRVDKLSAKETNTYVYFDNNPALALDRMIGVAEAVTRGTIEAGPLNILLAKVLQYNRYEGLRVGMGLQTNEQWSQVISIGGYAGYGFQDKALKFGGNIDLHVTKDPEKRLRLFYRQDVYEPANTTTIIKPDNQLLAEGYRGWLTSRMDSSEHVGGLYSHQVNSKLKVEVGASTEHRNPTYAYMFKAGDRSLASYYTTQIDVRVRYAIGEKRMSIGGIAVVTEKPSLFVELHASKGLQLRDALSYERIHTAIGYRFKTASFGETSLHAMTGWVSNSVPYSHMFNGRGTSQSVTFFYLENTFQTMGIYEFMANQYASLFFNQNLGSLLWRSSSKYSTPEVHVIHGAYWGYVRDIHQHIGILPSAADKGFFEGGLIVNKLLRIPYFRMLYFDVGAGAFYRYGHYRYDHFEENIAVKLMLSASL